MLQRPLPLRTFLNINLPKGEPKGYRVTVQARRNHVTSVAAAQVAAAVLERGMPKFTLLNVNVPQGRNKGFRVTVQAKRNHVTVVSQRMDPRHRAYYWIEEGENHWEPHDRSDYQAVRDGYISVTPLHPDLTAHQALAAVERLCVAREAEVR